MSLCLVVPIMPRRPLANVQFELHDINNRSRWDDGAIDFVHARSVSMAVSLICYEQLP